MKVCVNRTQLSWMIEKVVPYMPFDDAVMICDAQYKIIQKNASIVYIDHELLGRVAKMAFTRDIMDFNFLSICSRLHNAEKPKRSGVKYGIYFNPNDGRKIRAIKEYRDFLRSDVCIRNLGDYNSGLGTVKNLVEADVLCGTFTHTQVKEAETRLNCDGSLTFSVVKIQPTDKYLSRDIENYIWRR